MKLMININVSNQLVANIEFLFILFRRFPQLFVALERLRLPQKYWTHFLLSKLVWGDKDCLTINKQRLKYHQSPYTLQHRSKLNKKCHLMQPAGVCQRPMGYMTRRMSMTHVVLALSSTLMAFHLIISWKMQLSWLIVWSTEEQNLRTMIRGMAQA